MNLLSYKINILPLQPEQFTDAKFGVPTVRDILKELEKPGRDPRPEFKTAAFAEGVEDIKDLRPGMILEGVVSNVAAFGAFVDLGVHQDGLVHVSALSDKFVKDPREVVKTGDIVKVKVMEVDLARQRIGLSLRLTDEPGQARDTRSGESNSGQRQPSRSPKNPAPRNPGREQQPSKSSNADSALAEAFARAKMKG